MTSSGTRIRANLIDRREPVPKKKTHGQKRIVMLSHVGHRCERRSQDERRRRVLDGEVDGHRGSQRLAEVHDPRRIDVGATGQVRSGGTAVCGEPVLGRSPGIAAVAPIVDEKHLQSVPMERRRQGRPVRSIAGVPVEDQNGDARRRSGCRDEPAAQPEPVGRLEGHRLDIGQPDFTGRRHVRRRESTSSGAASSR